MYIENGGFGVYSILGKYSIKMNSSRNEVRSSFQCLDIIYDDMFQVLITSLIQSLKLWITVLKVESDKSMFQNLFLYFVPLF